jgi:hypothetical protein
MKRPGKPDTGNPSVRFDEGRSHEMKTDNYGLLNLNSWLCLLYQAHRTRIHEDAKRHLRRHANVTIGQRTERTE